MKNPGSRWVLLLLVCATTAGTAGQSTAHAQKQNTRKTSAANKPAAPADVSVQVTPEQARSFLEGLTVLAGQGKVAFVAEGVPLWPTLAPAKLPGWSGTLPLSEAVDKLAAAYDYAAQRKGNVFVLRKRYTDAHDLPDVTIEECRLAAQDVARLMSPFAPRVPQERGIDPPNTLSLDILAALSPEQRQAMQTRQLSVASLSSSQRAVLKRLSLFFYLHSSWDQANEVLIRLDKTPETRLCFRDLSASKQPERHFGFEFPDKRLGGRPYFSPFFRVIALNAQTTPPFGIVPTPEPGRDAIDRASAGATTLDAALTRLNARAAGTAAGSGPARFTADSALGPKTLTLVGDENEWNSTPALFSALADVYGLRVITEEDGTRRLARYRPRPVRDLADLAAAVHVALPAPLLRAAHEETLNPDRIRNPEPQLGPNATPEQWKAHLEQKKHILERRRQRFAFVARPDALQREAVRRLRLAVEPLLEKAGPDVAGVPVESLGAREQSAYAVAVTCDLLGEVARKLTPTLPPYVTHLDDAVLAGGPYQDADGETKFGLSLRYFDQEKNDWVSLVGMSNMRYNLAP